MAETNLRPKPDLSDYRGDGGDFDYLHDLEAWGDALEARRKDLEQRLGNLLARIHGDGGHYIVEHGWEKAEADADAKIVDTVAERDELLDTLRVYHHAWITDNRPPSFAIKSAEAMFAKHPFRGPWRCACATTNMPVLAHCAQCGRPRP